VHHRVVACPSAWRVSFEWRYDWCGAASWRHDAYHDAPRFPAAPGWAAGKGKRILTVGCDPGVRLNAYVRPGYVGYKIFSRGPNRLAKRRSQEKNKSCARFQAIRVTLDRLLPETLPMETASSTPAPKSRHRRLWRNSQPIFGANPNWFAPRRLRRDRHRLTEMYTFPYV